MSVKEKSKIAIIGVPVDLGAGTRGTNLGPEAIRIAGIVKRLEAIGYEVEDRGDIFADRKASKTIEGSNLKNLNEVLRINRLLCKEVSTVMEEGMIPVVLGGDHSIAIGTIFGVLQQKKNLGVIWFDAHGDINTSETSPSGNIHGMPVAVLTGMGHEDLTSIGGNVFLKRENLVYVGCRDLDEGERKAMKEQGIKVFTMYEIDDMGIKKVMEEAIKIAGEGTDGIHVSFDLDAVDPEVAPGTGTKVPGGMGYRETHHALEMIAMSNKLVSVEFVEVNPLLDKQNTTAEATVALAGSLLGEWLI
ncbi:MAG: arginase [Peptostreptococcaceae bacterium]|nr:arginase [Peptostreptococcaceae bacterium]